MYHSLRLPWSPNPSAREQAYRAEGLFKTRGTLYLLPPPTVVLRDTFNAPPRPKTRMSSGAVALCKHFERGGASSERGMMHPFWTLPRGSNEEKTEMAGDILEKMLADSVWRNVMLLHKDVAVYEIRNSRGFGMRWTLAIEEKKEQEMSGNLATPGHDEVGVEEAEKNWEIRQTTFRGFLEPVEGLDHELPKRNDVLGTNG